MEGNGGEFQKGLVEFQVGLANFHTVETDMGQNTFERKFDARKTSNLDWMIGRLREIEVGAPKASTIARAC